MEPGKEAGDPLCLTLSIPTLPFLHDLGWCPKWKAQESTEAELKTATCRVGKLEGRELRLKQVSPPSWSVQSVASVLEPTL